MVLDCALADAEVGGNVLAGMTSERQLHDLALTRGQTREALRRRLPPNRQLARIPDVFQGMFDVGEQFVAVDRLLDEIRSPGPHRLDRHRHVALAGDHDGLQPATLALEPLQQREPAHPGHPGIDQQAPFATGTIGVKERLGTGIGLDRPAIFLEQIAHRLPHRAVIVDHEDRLRSLLAGRFGGPLSARLHPRQRLSEAALDQADQLLRLHRLVQMQVAVLGDLAQGGGRDVAGEDHRRDLVTEGLPQAGDDLEAVQTFWQIVVGDDEIRAYRPSLRQLQRLSPILGGRRAVTLAFEQKREHLTHRRVVLDDQDCAALVYVFLHFARVEPRAPGRPASTERYLDGKHRALARTGTDIDSEAQQVRQALHDGEAESETLAALARRIVELMELLENRLKLLFGNADPGIPDLDAQLVAAPPAAKQDLALIGVFHCVREQVADHLLEQAWIAAHAEPARGLRASRGHAPLHES